MLTTYLYFKKSFVVCRSSYIMLRRYSMIFCLAMFCCTPDSQPVEIDAEIIEMNWYSSVKDFYVPEIVGFESSLDGPPPGQGHGNQ